MRLNLAGPDAVAYHSADGEIGDGMDVQSSYDTSVA